MKAQKKPIHGYQSPTPNKKKSHKCCKARGIESKVSCSKREQSCSGIESQRGQTIHEISKRKGRSSVFGEAGTIWI